ncbi:MAG: aminotransferase class I/II-fold pyridoxal phosphate-dependent enzyme [Treponema sp.]|nr:aminotransferase class I/II-fold pyridoxal phosphate-dependent enzyme [Treponema sp.]
MSVFWNKRTAGLSPYVPGEQPKDRAFIKLNTNENPYPPSPKAVGAMLSLLKGGGETLRLYPDPLCSDFREAVAAAYGVKKEQVFPGNGSDEVLAFAFGAFFGETAAPEVPSPREVLFPREILFPDITYSFYPVYARLWGLPYRGVPLTGTRGEAGGRDETGKFSVRVEDYLVPSGGVVLPNPNAPTGRALPFGESPREGIRAIVEYQLTHNKVVVIDEAYAAFGAESAVPFIDRYPNLLTVHTLSKSASLAGLRAGFAIGGEELIEGLFRVRDSFNSYTMDRLALAGAAAAVADRAYYDAVNKKVTATRERTAAALAAMGFEVIPSKANFLFVRWPGRPEAEGDARPVPGGAELLAALRERGILVRRFDAPRIADYLRVSIGTDSDMDAFLAAIREIIGRE